MSDLQGSQACRTRLAGRSAYVETLLSIMLCAWYASRRILGISHHCRNVRILRQALILEFLCVWGMQRQSDRTYQEDAQSQSSSRPSSSSIYETGCNLLGRTDRHVVNLVVNGGRRIAD